MALKPTLVQRIESLPGLLRAYAIFGAVVVAMAVLTVAFGFTISGPSYDFVVDPGAGLPGIV